MNKKTLALKLSKLQKFEKPDYKLEQYQTPSEIAAETLWTAFMNKDIENKTIADLGCGNGILGIGSILLGAKKVYFIDIDEKMINLTKENFKKLDIDEDKAKFINKDVRRFNEKVDTILQNPPFGVKKIHMDRVFLKKAMFISNKIYSFHKTSTESFITKLVKDEDWNYQKLYSYQFPLKKTMKYHIKRLEFTEVDLWMFNKKSTKVF